MTAADWHLVGFSSGMAALSVLLLGVPGLALAWLLARFRWPGKSVVETLVALPLALPPIATGLILLKLLGRRGPIGGWLHDTWGIDIAFTWRGVVVALAVMSLPLLVRTARVAFEEVDRHSEEMAAILGAGPLRVFFTVTLPLAWRGVLGGLVLAYARALGEFGATIMLAGNIPGVTSTLSLAIYQSVQVGEDERAFGLLIISAALAFLALWTSEWLLRKKRPNR